MPRLLLINPPFGRKILGQTPLNLAYLAATAEKCADVRIIDLNVVPESNLEYALQTFRPTHVGVTSYTPNNREAKEILRKIHRDYQNIVLISGGPHEQYRGEITRKMYPWIHHVVTDKYAENALVKILIGRDTNIDWRDLFPAYHLLNMHEPTYRFDPKIFPGKHMLQYMSSRGCNMKCLFCPSADFVPLEVPTIIDHLLRIQSLEYEAVFFNDVNFVSLPEHTMKLARVMIEADLNKHLEWGCQTAAVHGLSDTLLHTMRKAGCTYITFSLESAVPEALRLIRKNIDPEVVKAKARFCKSLGMQVGLYVMFGIHPDEEMDWQWAQRTLDMVEEINPDFISYSVLADYPSSNPSLSYETESFGQEDVWRFFDEGHAYHPNCSTQYAKRLMTEIERRHLTWKTRIF